MDQLFVRGSLALAPLDIPMTITTVKYKHDFMIRSFH